MNLSDLRQHVADYTEVFAPHLRGEFQAFVNWVEDVKPAVSPEFIPPVPAPLAEIDPVKQGEEVVEAIKDK